MTPRSRIRLPMLAQPAARSAVPAEEEAAQRTMADYWRSTADRHEAEAASAASEAGLLSHNAALLRAAERREDLASREAPPWNVANWREAQRAHADEARRFGSAAKELEDRAAALRLKATDAAALARSARQRQQDQERAPAPPPSAPPLPICPPARLGAPSLGAALVSKDERDALLGFVNDAERAIAEFDAWRKAGGSDDSAAIQAAQATITSTSPLVLKVAQRMASDAPSDWEGLGWYEARALSDYGSAAAALGDISRAHPAAAKAGAAGPEESFWPTALIGLGALALGLYLVARRAGGG